MNDQDFYREAIGILKDIRAGIASSHVPECHCPACDPAELQPAPAQIPHLKIYFRCLCNKVTQYCLVDGQSGVLMCECGTYYEMSFADRTMNIGPHKVSK